MARPVFARGRHLLSSRARRGANSERRLSAYRARARRESSSQRKFLAYGALGWIVEVCFTGAAEVLQKNRAASAKTYLWMHPIYGSGGLLLEALGRRIVRLPRLARGGIYALTMLALELGSGSLLRRLLGECPWRYPPGRLCVRGLVRLDYAPLWLALGLAFEPVRDRVDRAERGWAMQRRPMARWLVSHA